MYFQGEFTRTSHYRERGTIQCVEFNTSVFFSIHVCGDLELISHGYHSPTVLSYSKQNTFYKNSDSSSIHTGVC